MVKKVPKRIAEFSTIVGLIVGLVLLATGAGITGDAVSSGAKTFGSVLGIVGALVFLVGVFISIMLMQKKNIKGKTKPKSKPKKKVLKKKVKSSKTKKVVKKKRKK